MKMLSRLDVEGNFSKLIQNIYKTPTANIILNSEKVDAEIRNKAGMSTLTTTFQHCPGNLS